ncbi:MAG: helicase-related protein, partial [Actinomycetes bacterium]
LDVDAVAIHGNRTQGQRQRALDAFARGQVRVMVATDVAARGIHISDVDLIVHVDPPNDHKDYLHRSGRTARAGSSGVVVSLLQREQLGGARRLFGNAGLRVEESAAAPGSPSVRLLAESGEPVVVQPETVPRSAERDGNVVRRDRTGGRDGRPPRRPRPRTRSAGRRAA